MRILELNQNQYFNDSSVLTVQIDEEELNNDFGKLHIHDTKTFFLKNGYIIKDAVAVEFRREIDILSNTIYLTVKFLFDKLLTEEEYEKLWAVI